MSDYFCFAKLSHDIIMEILKKLPPQTLIQLRCVSKFFNSLISDPNFINLHLSSSSSSSTTSHHILYYPSKTKTEILHFSIHDSHTFSLLKVLKPQLKIGRLYTDLSFLGSVKGVVCLKDANEYYTDSYLCIEIRYVDTLILWNPFIGRFHVLPPLKRVDFSWFVFGFGFDHKKRDFKAVRILYNYMDNDRAEVLVYEVKIGSWRRIDEVVVPCLIPQKNYSNVFANGAVHWLAYKQRNPNQYCCIMGFDVAKEVFKVIDFPENLPPTNATLFVLGEKSLALSFVHFNNVDKTKISIVWSLNDYGLWTKKYNMVLGQEFFSKKILNDGKILASRRKFWRNSVLIDTEKDEIKDISTCEMQCFDAASYMPSLALLDIGQQLIE